jgi:excinuclease ABC subunit B
MPKKSPTIVPQAIKKDIADSLKTIYETAEETVELAVAETGEDYDINEVIHQLETEMLEAAEALEFERAATLRDQIKELKDD